MIPASAARWMLIPRPRPGADLRLLCFPHAGGGASAYHRWSAELPPEIEMWAIQLPGHETRLREPLPASLSDLVDRIADDLAPVLERPYALFGHSLGALVAFELARARRGRGLSLPQHLMVSGRPGPQCAPSPAPLHGLPEGAFLEAISSRYGGIPAAVRAQPELMALFVPVLRADMLLGETYRYRGGEPLPCPLSAFGGLSDPTTDRAGLEAWGEHTSRSFSCEMFPGDHFYTVPSQGPLLQEIAGRLLGASGG